MIMSLTVIYIGHLLESEGELRFSHELFHVIPQQSLR